MYRCSTPFGIQAPARLAVATLCDNRKSDRFQRFEIAPNGAGILRVIIRNGMDQLIQGQAVRPFEAAEQMPLARNLIVARHKFRIRFGAGSWINYRKTPRPTHRQKHVRSELGFSELNNYIAGLCSEIEMTQPDASHIARDSIKVFVCAKKKAYGCKRSLLSCT
jgi:hypothetical protein